MVRRHPVILAVIARHILTRSLDGARQGYRIARTELGEAVPPHAVDSALAAYRDEGRRLAVALRGWSWWSASCAPSLSRRPSGTNRRPHAPTAQNGESITA